jgi:ABC-type amino acid transport substrate-binding protein
VALAWCGLAAIVTHAPAAQAAQVLQRIKESGEFRVGYRADARPHSFVDASGQPAGYVVGLCRAVARALQQTAGYEQVRVEYVQVTAANRFDMVHDGKIDLLCEATSMSLSRREVVNFSIPTFADGAGMLHRRDTPVSKLEDLAGKRVGVLAGTTSETTLRNSLSQLKVKAEVVAVKNHGDGAAMLSDGKLDVYFADRSILNALLYRQEIAKNLELARGYFSYETYGLAMQRGDDDFRLLVDRALARQFREGAVEREIEKAFGAPPDNLLRLLIAINAIPE